MTRITALFFLALNLSAQNLIPGKSESGRVVAEIELTGFVNYEGSTHFTLQPVLVRSQFYFFVSNGSKTVVLDFNYLKVQEFDFDTGEFVFSESGQVLGSVSVHYDGFFGGPTEALYTYYSWVIQPGTAMPFRPTKIGWQKYTDDMEGGPTKVETSGNLPEIAKYISPYGYIDSTPYWNQTEWGFDLVNPQTGEKARYRLNARGSFPSSNFSREGINWHLLQSYCFKGIGPNYYIGYDIDSLDLVILETVPKSGYARNHLSPVRAEPREGAPIYDRLPRGYKVKIVQHTLPIRVEGVEERWYLVEYKRAGFKVKGWIWGGNLD